MPTKKPRRPAGKRMVRDFKIRIKAHGECRIGDIVPHPLNPRTHSDEQQTILAASLKEIGFFRSLTVFRLTDGRLQCLDGHLRIDTIHPDVIVPYEELDVTPEEGMKILLTMDPLASLAGYDQDKLDEVRDQVATDDEDLDAFWRGIDAEDEETARQIEEETGDAEDEDLAEQFLILIDCGDEATQRRLLARFEAEGLTCKALTS